MPAARRLSSLTTRLLVHEVAPDYGEVRRDPIEDLLETIEAKPERLESHGRIPHSVGPDLSQERGGLISMHGPLGAECVDLVSVAVIHGHRRCGSAPAIMPTALGNREPTSALDRELEDLFERTPKHSPGRLIRDLAVMLADGGHALCHLAAVRDPSCTRPSTASRRFRSPTCSPASTAERTATSRAGGGRSGKPASAPLAGQPLEALTQR
jgi:hypothetical protein